MLSIVRHLIALRLKRLVGRSSVEKLEAENAAMRAELETLLRQRAAEP